MLNVNKTAAVVEGSNMKWQHQQRRLIAITFFLLVFCSTTFANAIGFYLPGVNPTDYNSGDDVTVHVNSLRSLSHVLPYDYYKGPFCKPQKIVSNPQSLGEVIWGDRVQSSLYSLKMRVNQSCVLVDCVPGADKILRENLDNFEKLIDNGYRGQMSIDNLPMYNPGVPLLNGRCTGDVPIEQRYAYQRGYALGVNKNCIGRTLINNHIHFNVRYHAVPASEAVTFGTIRTNATDSYVFRVVGLTGVPYSIKHAKDGGDCNANFRLSAPDITVLPLSDFRDSEDAKVWWSYSSTWTEAPNVFWTTRWDAYLSTSVADRNATVHWYGIIFFIMITLCLLAIVTFILMRALHLDIDRYNASSTPEDLREDSGWKLVHADVFRPPAHAQLLAVVTGNGIQLLLMCAFVLVFALLGFLSPASRGMLLTAVIVTYVLLGFAGGYACGRLLVMFGEENRTKVIPQGLLFPCAVCVCYVFTDIINAVAGASDSVPSWILLLLFLFWLCINVPLSLGGGLVAFRQTPIKNPLPVSRLAREIPPQPWLLSPPFLYFIPALAPLAPALNELKYLLSSFWQGMVYYVFGFLTIAFIIWALTTILTTLVATYYMLVFENHQWWWPSFIAPGGLGVPLLLYSIFYYYTELHITGVSGSVIYFTYMSLLSLAYGVMAGSIGFLSSLFFAQKIYGTIKID